MASLDEYADKYPSIRMERRNGILQMTFHTDGGPLQWGGNPHKEFSQVFVDVSSDTENRIVIMTGTGDAFTGPQGTAAGTPKRAPKDWDQTYWWEIREEITRLANFQAGLLDTGSFGSPSITAIQNLQNPDIKYMAIPGAYWIHLDFTGGYYYNDHPAHSGANAKTPIGAGDTFEGIIDLIEMKAYYFDSSEMGAVVEQREIPKDMLEMADLIRRPSMFSYIDGDEYVFLDKEDYTPYHLNKDSIADEVLFINEDTDGIQVVIVSEVPVALDLPMSVELEVVETDPSIKGASATSRTKPATLSTGLVVQVPEYISTGEWIKVNTEERKFQSRADKH